ncbi:efflux RND transporter periplasmic adaptor subunit [Methylophilus sp. 13]|jgi:membrane fusion protein, multidrug efflux system|uniref:efflux RND transporter periplasmic adaptor subunit n=1 Tax=Methylophilus sp. 13 TaxID=2781018 RepID=UPI00188F176D|nr:efflux RND transporter periplasmic adaptor subunit [Methylophilus sp. 13]MBF5039907.1 efflux RND transporter periplasmic adaptor subunit [Methylophilus sp. 13]
MMKQHLIVLGLLGSLLGACHKEEAHKEELPKLEVTTPMRKDTTLIKEYVCQIHAIRHIEMRALERGYLQDIFVDEGKYVKAGQPMFKIMPNIYQAELMRAKAEANAIQIEYENTKALAEKNVVSLNELAIAKAKLDKALAEVNLHQTHLNFTDINAPFDGIMDHLFVRKGSLMQEGDLLTTLSDISKMWVYFNVPESEYLDFKARHEDEKQVKVHLRMANGQVFNQQGVIETIEADFDNKTGNIEFRAGFMNPERLLRHGETGNIMMDIPYKNAMLIPQKAIFEILDQQYVFVVGKDHKLEQRLVKVAADIQDMSIIESGLQDTDHVLIEGLRRVTKGDKIIEDFKTPDKVVPELKLYAE